jgi:hypothetical protein
VFFFSWFKPVKYHLNLRVQYGITLTCLVAVNVI